MSVRVIPPEIPLVDPVLEPEAAPVARVDILRLREVVRGRRADVPRSHAIALLVATNHPSAADELAGVLHDTAAPTRLRALAALSLARLSGPRVESILIEAMRSEAEPVLAAVIRALGRIGTEQGLRAIEAAAGLPGVAARQAEFAAALISHRLGLEGHEFSAPAAKDLLVLPEAAARPFRVQRLTYEDADMAVTTLAREPFGIAYDAAALHQVRCADNRWLIAFNREVTSGRSVERLASRPAFAGVLASYQRENQTYSARWLILTAPERGRRVRIHVRRLLGEPGFFGSGEVSAARDAIRFSLRSVAGPGAFPVEVEGRYLENGRLEIDTARAGLFVPVSRRPIRGIVLPPTSDPSPARPLRRRGPRAAVNRKRPRKRGQ